MTDRVLVIRTGALGDMLLASKAFASLRVAFPHARLACLTSPSYADLAGRMPWFDAVIAVPKASSWQWDRWLALRHAVRAFAPTHVFDFQSKPRQAVLHALLGGPFCSAAWSGASPFATHPRPWPPRTGIHVTDFWDDQCRAAGIAPLLDWPSMEWIVGDIPPPLARLPERPLIVIPGCSPNHTYKRWPFFAALTRRAIAEGWPVVAVGAESERDVLDSLAAEVPLFNACGMTPDIPSLAAVLRRARLVVGNDTGPMHLAALLDLPTCALLSGHTRAAWSHPIGRAASFLQADHLHDLSPETVWHHITRA